MPLNPYYHIDKHPIWETLRPYLFLNGEAPRERIEIRVPRDWRIKQQFLDVRQRCVTCGREMDPCRERQKTEPQFASSMFLTVSCDGDTRKGCSRSHEAHVEAERLARLIKGFADPFQPPFDFDEEPVPVKK
jgi:hypothetical protein